MNTTKFYKTFLSIFFLCICLINARGQQHTSFSIDTMAVRYARFFTQKCALNQKQQQQMEQAYKQRYVAFQAENNTKDTVNRKQALKKADKEFMKTLKDLMTATQYKTYEALTSQQREQLKKQAAEKNIRIRED